jgi:hypothetical protein
MKILAEQPQEFYFASGISLKRSRIANWRSGDDI